MGRDVILLVRVCIRAMQEEMTAFRHTANTLLDLGWNGFTK